MRGRQLRIVFVQYGDYRTAVENFAAGGAETYAAQRYSGDLVSELAQRHEHGAVICVNTDPHDERLGDGVHVQGLRLYSQVSVPGLVARVAAVRPTHLIS